MSLLESQILSFVSARLKHREPFGGIMYTSFVYLPADKVGAKQTNLVPLAVGSTFSA